MLHAGLDLSRRKVDVCLLSQSGEHVDQLAAPPDADAQVALAGNTWTQAGDEMNVAWLKAELTNNACVGGPGSPVGSSLVLNVKVDGTVVAPFVIGSTSPLWTAFPVELEPGTATPHTLTVEATHSCGRER